MTVSARLAAFGAFFLLLPLAGVAGGMALPLMQTLAAPAVAPWRRLPALQPAQAALAAGAALLLAWATIAAAWGEPRGATQAAKLCGGALVGLAFAFGAHALSDKDRRAFATLAATSVLALAGLLAFEAMSGMALSRLFQPEPADWVIARNPGKGVAVLTLMTFPVAALLAGRERMGLAGAAFAVLAALWLGAQFGMAANFVAAAFGALAALAALRLPRLVPALLFAVAGFAVIAAPLMAGLARQVLSDSADHSWRARATIWEFVAARIAEKPWFGWGMDASRTFDDARMVLDGIDQPAIPLHPHNMPLQIWLELGAVGAGLAALTLFAAAWAWAHARRSRGSAFAVAGAAGAGFVYALVSFGAWQEWWIAAQFLAAALAVTAGRQQLKAADAPPAPPPPA